ncbi:MAG: FlgD immunoglobulin-like domain containing protein [Candidatus Krumholzibacteria bacterium]|nr:FlgD immunoglobulin-like domain containing protein [Candidatus Krumholzibacteria bacterium]
MIRTDTYGYCGRAASLALGLCIIAAAGTGALAQEQRGGAPGDWLSSYATARTIGVGGAFVSVADEPIGTLWNPAALTQVFRNVIFVETARLFEETTINSISFGTPERRMLPGFGLTVIALDSGVFERTNELNDVTGEFGEGETAYVLSASKSVGRRMALGANIKIIRQQIDEFSASGAGIDVGALFHALPSVTIGASMLNVGGPGLTLRDTEESYPLDYRGGATLRFLGGRAMVTTEISSRPDYGTRLHAGTEFQAHPMLALRMGYNDEYFSGGASFALASGIRIDYGMSDHLLGITHRFGLSYGFGGFYAASQAEPSVFSPIGAQSVTRFDLEARTKADARSWSLEVVDKSDQVVRRFSGAGLPPAHVMWDGKNEMGMPLADGIYTYQLVVVDTEGRETAGRKRTVEITTAGPQGDVPIIVGESE